MKESEGREREDRAEGSTQIEIKGENGLSLRAKEGNEDGRPREGVPPKVLGALRSFFVLCLFVLLAQKGRKHLTGERRRRDSNGTFVFDLRLATVLHS